MSTVTVDIARAEQITGWMSPTELTWLAERAQEHELIVELGSYLGRSTRALADNAKGVVYAIDRWQPMDFPSPTAGWHGDRIFQKFLEHNMEAVASGRLQVIRADHDNYSAFPVEWLRSQNPEEHPDLVFIDGDHAYDAVKRDILAWQTRIRRGGLLCGHDANNSDWLGVNQALAELLPDANYVEGTQLWWVRWA